MCKLGMMWYFERFVKFYYSPSQSQTFDRKSINIAPRDFSNHVCAFANADGGIIVVGISDKTKRIEGVDSREHQVNELLRVPMDFCMPTVPFVHEFVECVDSTGKPNHVLVFHIEASPLVHENQAHDAYIRVGDKSKVLSYEDRMTLSLDKGLRSFEDILVPDSSYDDIDEVYLKEYLQMIGYSRGPQEYLLQNKNFAKEKANEMRLSVAAILLFGKKPQLFFPRARVRFIRYEGTEEKFGAETMRKVEREVYLKVLDTLWMQHLENMQHLREGIHWRSVGQRDPLVEYRSESQKLFDGLQRNLREEVLRILLTITPSEAAADNAMDGEEYESELTKMAETQTERETSHIDSHVGG